MLQTPATASPHNVAVDVYAPITFSFLHTGSEVNTVRYNVYGAEESTSLEEFWLSSITAYNGDMIEKEYEPQELENGKNYKWQAIQYQTAYDLFQARGKVLKKDFIRHIYTEHPTEFANHIPADVQASEITDVEQLIPITYGTTYIEGRQYNGNTLVGCQYLEINGERRKILGLWESYVHYLEYSTTPLYTSAIIIESPFTTYPDPEPDIDEPEIDITLRVFKNYLKTPFFFFKAREVPALTISASISSGAICCSGSYTQGNGVAIKSYKWALGSAESETEYSERLSATFRQPPVGSYAMELAATTQDDYEVTQSGTVTFPAAPVTQAISSISVSVDKTNGKATITAATSDSVVIYRKQSGGQYEAITALTAPADGAVVVYDAAIANNATYQYMALPFASGAVSGAAAESAEVSTHFGRSYIAVIAESDAIFGAAAFDVESTFQAKINQEYGDIVHNTGTEAEKTVWRFPAVGYSAADYRSGTVSFVLGDFSCGAYTGTAAMLDALHAAIEESRTFLLRTEKGENILCKLSGDWTHANSSKMYCAGEQITVVSIGFVEIGDASGIIVR